MTDVKPAGKNSKRVLGPEELQPYYDLMVAQDLAELEIREKEFYLRLARPSAGVAPVYAPAAPPLPAPGASAGPAPEGPPPEQNQFHSVASPLAGVFYRAPSPASEPFVKEGDKVAHNQVLCIVEAMKVMNEIRADRPSTVRKILVENGKPVTAGQNLFLVDPVA